MLSRIFDLFVQGGGDDVARSEGGLGVGLALVQSFVRLHGGEVSARSEGRGRGSELIVELPVIDEQAERTLASLTPIVPRTGRRLLLVDDNVDAAELLGEFLEALGHEVSIAHDGPSALALLDRFRPEVAVLDVGLPVMDGYELARRVRALVDDCRLIALTGYGQESDRARSAAAGFAVHLVKPVDIDLLVRALAGG